MLQKFLSLTTYALVYGLWFMVYGFSSDQNYKLRKPYIKELTEQEKQRQK